MTHSSKVTTDHLRRRAVVYVRQSTPGQVVSNLESQRRQYQLADQARAMGFTDIQTIDDDLGRSGSGRRKRPGFDRLVAQLAARQVGAVFSLEASRLARNGREWHMLLDMCALSNAVIAGPEGVYDPRRGDDRLFLGLKGTFSEYELSIMRQRAQGAIVAKARRGEHRFMMPVGLCWPKGGSIDLNPDLRVQDAIRLIYRKYEELGTMRQTLLWFHQEGIKLPSVGRPLGSSTVAWVQPRMTTINRVIRSPLYAGAYVWGRTTKGENNAVILKPQAEWRVLLIDHHPGYISWNHFLRIRKMVADNAFSVSTGRSKAGRGGKALLASLLRCGRCSRRLHTTYTGRGLPRYKCPGTVGLDGQKCAVSFSGTHADDAVGDELLRAVEVPAIQAAIAAAEAILKRSAERLKVAENELRHARYQAQLAERRYDQVDPDNRLVAPQLEQRWNAALAEVSRAEQRVAALAEQPEPTLDTERLVDLAAELPRVWHDDRADAAAKQRIARALIEEVIVDVDLEQGLVLITVHWKGGRHSKLTAQRRRMGQHRLTTSMEVVEIVRRMGAYHEDLVIARTLNLLGLKTANGHTWTASNVGGLRVRKGLTHAALRQEADERPAVTLLRAAEHLNITTIAVRKLIKQGILPADQVVPFAPWRIFVQDLERPEVLQAVAATRKYNRRGSRKPKPDNLTLAIPGV